MMNLKHTLLLLLAICSFTFTACDKEEENCSIPARFQDMTGLDGCGFILVLDLEDEERRLEPINLDDFDITPVDGMDVCIEFEVRTDMGSICMVGEIVELTAIE